MGDGERGVEGGVGLGGWGQSGCDRRIEGFGKIYKKKILRGCHGVCVGSGGRVIGGGGGGQGGCERIIEVFGKLNKKKNIFFLEGGSRGPGVGLGGGGGSGWM